MKNVSTATLGLVYKWLDAVKNFEKITAILYWKVSGNIYKKRSSIGLGFLDPTLLPIFC